MACFDVAHRVTAASAWLDGAGTGVRDYGASLPHWDFELSSASVFDAATHAFVFAGGQAGLSVEAPLRLGSAAAAAAASAAARPRCSSSMQRCSSTRSACGEREGASEREEGGAVGAVGSWQILGTHLLLRVAQTPLLLLPQLTLLGGRLVDVGEA